MDYAIFRFILYSRLELYIMQRREKNELRGRQNRERIL